VAVRCGWTNFPLCNLFSKAGLPANPFRTDDFPMPVLKNDKVKE
jgi:sialate O-acetylesterase